MDDHVLKTAADVDETELHWSPVKSTNRGDPESFILYVLRKKPQTDANPFTGIMCFNYNW